METTEQVTLRSLVEHERSQKLIADTTTYMQSIYGMAKSNLVPKSQLDRLTAAETAIAERVVKLSEEYAVIDTVDTTLATVRSRAGSASAKAVAARDQAVDRFDGIVNAQIDSLEKVLGLEATAEEAEELASEDLEVAETKPFPRMVRLTTRASKKIQKRAFNNLTTLRERTEQVQHLDLIQYAADYLDIDEKDTRERIASAKTYVAAKAATVIDPTQAAYTKALEKTTATVADMQEAIQARRAAVINRAHDFYAVLIVEYLGMEEKDVSTKTFVTRVRAVLGDAWNTRLAKPTEKYFDFIKAEWAKTAAEEVVEVAGEHKVADQVRLAAQITQSNARRVDKFLRNVTPQAKTAVASAFAVLSESVQETWTTQKAVVVAKAAETVELVKAQFGETKEAEAAVVGETKVAAEEEDDEDL